MSSSVVNGASRPAVVVGLLVEGPGAAPAVDEPVNERH